ncbi:MAG: ATP-binding protein [Deltaproteobacteria bacterium]|nr:ATP-binding protein [Deltaproteobacteria bacterium]
METKSQRRVLIVDPDPEFGLRLEHDFSARGFKVQTVATAAEATSGVAENPPDLVLLDPHLPQGAAATLVRQWKKEAPALVVMLVSGNASLNVVVESLNEGARRFFTKPVSVTQIIDELEERQPDTRPFLSPRIAGNHQLGSAALNAEGVDRFFAVSPGLLCVLGFDGSFKMLNPAWEKTLGYSIDELCAQPYLDLVHPEDRDKATGEALEMCAGQAVFRFKNRFRCSDGSYRWLSWIATPSPAHRLIYASARDVTNNVRMEQGLRESNEWLKRVAASRETLLVETRAENTALVELGQFKDDVSAMLVHDLKNPLSVIVANYSYILEAFEGPRDCLDALHDAQQAGLRMIRLLANLVDVAHLEHGTFNVDATDVPLSAIMGPIAAQRRVLAQSRNIEILALSAPEVLLRVDTDLMTRIVENIFDNAIRHTPNGGIIEIATNDVGGDVEIRIGNTGRAIPLSFRETIFEKYGQATPEVGRMNLGLGLYFCKLAIQAHGGRIWVEETERMPTVFVLRLPRLAIGSAAPVLESQTA